MRNSSVLTTLTDTGTLSSVSVPCRVLPSSTLAAAASFDAAILAVTSFCSAAASASFSSVSSLSVSYVGPLSFFGLPIPNIRALTRDGRACSGAGLLTRSD